ncbi:478_t:CDS:2, partial [Entrophospora sp. SA101]
EQEDNIASQEPEGGLPLPTTPIDTIFDPLKGCAQMIRFIILKRNEWTSIPLCISDCVSSKESKTQQDVSTQDLPYSGRQN